MKIEIKSVLIGVLLTVNVLLLLGFDENQEKVEDKFPIGRYQLAFDGDADTDTGYVIDTKYGYIYPYIGPLKRVSFKKWNEEMVNENLRINNFKEVPRFNSEIKKLMPGNW
mgnify:CR=1 FL=1|tara:strand:- start:442 stop:774 length:333 start_codon:yes stop_codon:yes gene_type:complete